MLTAATLGDVQTYGDWVYDLALDPTKSSYPTYADGIKTRADFGADARRSVTQQNGELLLFSRGGTVEGWIQYFWIPEERYLQLTACSIREGTAQALTELLERLEARFPGYALYFGFPGENTQATAFLAANGFRCIEDDWNYVFDLGGVVPQAVDAHVVRIGRENYGIFRALHDQAGEEMYWNSDRIEEHLDEWSIFAYVRTGEGVGTVFLRTDGGLAEIFGLEFAAKKIDVEACRALLAAALAHTKRLGMKYLMFLGEAALRPVLHALGFRCVGRYCCYVRTLPER